MTRRRMLLLATAAVCIVLAVLLCVSAVSVYREGSLRREQDPLADVYSPETVAEKLGTLTPLFLLFAVLAASDLALGIRDDRPRKADPSFSGTVRALPPRKHGKLQAALLVLALFLTLLGILNGSALDVLNKAITICSECIGLG